MFVAYILYSSQKSRFYTCSSFNHENRLEEHNKGLVQSTKYGVPWKKIWTSKPFSTRSEAKLLERKIKKRGARRFLEDIGHSWE